MLPQIEEQENLPAARKDTSTKSRKSKKRALNTRNGSMPKYHVEVKNRYSVLRQYDIKTEMEEHEQEIAKDVEKQAEFNWQMVLRSRYLNDFHEPTPSRSTSPVPRIVRPRKQNNYLFSKPVVKAFKSKSLKKLMELNLTPMTIPRRVLKKTTANDT